MPDRKKQNGPEKPSPPDKRPLSDAELAELERRRLRREKEYQDWLRDQGRSSK